MRSFPLFRPVGILVLASVIFLQFCREKETKAYSGYHFDKNKMVNILTDLVLAEGNDRVLKKYGYNAPVIIDSSYQFIYKKYNLEKWQMDSSFKYYANRPEEFSEMMDIVLENLNRLEK